MERALEGLTRSMLVMRLRPGRAKLTVYQCTGNGKVIGRELGIIGPATVEDVRQTGGT